METAISVLNKTVLNYLTSEGLLSWQRLLLANRLASNPPDWAFVFSAHRYSYISFTSSTNSSQ